MRLSALQKTPKKHFTTVYKMFFLSRPSPLCASLLLTESKRITPTHLWSFFLTNLSDHWWAGFTNLQLLKIPWRCTVRLLSGCYLLSLSSISQDTPTSTPTHRTGCAHQGCVCVIGGEVWNKSFSGTTGLFTRHSLQCYRNTPYAQVL